MGQYYSPEGERQDKRRTRRIKRSGLPYKETSYGATIDDLPDRKGRSTLSLTSELDTRAGKRARKFMKARKNLAAEVRQGKWTKRRMRRHKLDL